MLITFRSLESADAFLFALDLFCPAIARQAVLYDMQGSFGVEVDDGFHPNQPAAVEVVCDRIPFARD